MSLYGDPGAAPEKQIANMKQNLELLQSLQLHPGWHLMLEYFDGELKAVVAQLTNTRDQTGESALKAAVAYTLLSKIRDLPREFEETLLASLALQKK